MAKQVFLKKDEKIQDVISKLHDGFTDDDFVAAFRELYPEDWNKIVKRYEEHERKTKPGKSHPMPHPRQYLLNVAHKQLRDRRTN